VCAEGDAADAVPVHPKEHDAELEAEVAAIAVMFERLPGEWKRYLDNEACHGRDAYIRT
jgi:hypothetical protein